MIIDFHTHTFPEKIAGRALGKLAHMADSRPYTDGTADDLIRSEKQAGIDLSVILPVATSPSQHETINRTAVLVSQEFLSQGLLSFGGIHPDNENYREILSGLAEKGIRGIKLHPVYQRVPFDDIRNLRILDCASELGLIVIIHAGYDIGYPGESFASPRHILSAIEQVHPQKLVLAHMGGWACWDEVERDLAGAPVWLDTSFSITPIRPPEDSPHAGQEAAQMDLQQFLRIIEKHGAHRILFGTDSPWSEQKEALHAVCSSGCSPGQLQLILGENAKKLLAL